MTYRIVNNKNSLYHHGIGGQKWGVKNGPPYPLDASDHSAAEKKAAGYKATSNNKEEAVKKKFKMSDSQKATIKRCAKIGATVVATGLALYGAKKISSFVGPMKTNSSEKARKVIGKAYLGTKTTASRMGKNFVKNVPDGMVIAGGKIGKAAGFTLGALGIKEFLDICGAEKVYKKVEQTYNNNNKKDRLDFNVRKK